MDDETCIGYKINVYQESINQLIPEYLVNYDYLNRIMEDYGFSLINMEDAKKLGLPESSGMFIELYNLMMNEINRYPSKKNEYGQSTNMNMYEKDISFMNRYFVYKKIRTVNAEKIAESFISHLPEEIEFEKIETKKAKKAVEKGIKESKPKAKKLNKTIILEEATEALSTSNKDKVLEKELEEPKEKESKEKEPKEKEPKEKENSEEELKLEIEVKEKPKKPKKVARKKLENFVIDE